MSARARSYAGMTVQTLRRAPSREPGDHVHEAIVLDELELHPLSCSCPNRHVWLDDEDRVVRDRWWTCWAPSEEQVVIRTGRVDSRGVPEFEAVGFCSEC